jgi:glucose/arabinose dehydrogenase
MSTSSIGRRSAWEVFSALLLVGVLIAGCTSARANGERMAQTATATPPAQPTQVAQTVPTNARAVLPPGQSPNGFTLRPVIQKLVWPLEVLYGPDGFLSLAYSDFEIPAGVPTQQESDWDDPNFVPPIYTFGTVADDYDFQPEVCEPNYYICWPTVAPTGLEVYDGASGAIADWPTSLLVTALKTGTVYRLELSEDGVSVVGAAEELVKTTNRYRDLFIDPTSGAFYVITDSGNNTQVSFRIPTAALEHPGALLEFSYTSTE